MRLLFLQKRMVLAAAVFLAVSAPLYGQDARVVFPERTISIERSFAEIEKQTDYLISVSHTDFDMSRKVRLTRNNLTVGNAMTQLLARSRRRFSVRGNHIVVFADNQPEPPVPAEPETVAEPVIEPVAQEPEIDLTKPPVNVDSLELALRARIKQPEPAQLLPEPALDMTAYYNTRDGKINYTGKPGYMSNMPKLALRTDLLYGFGTLTPNLGLDIALSPRSTLLVTGSYNGWGLNNDDKDKMLCHWLTSVEYRYWFCERFNGHFLGAHGFFGNYHVKGVDIPFMFKKGAKDFRHKGQVYGAGISYGYQLPLSVRWGLEFNAGIGIGFTKYDKYNCDRCSDAIETGLKRTFVAPTKLGINLVFIIK